MQLRRLNATRYLRCTARGADSESQMGSIIMESEASLNFSLARARDNPLRNSKAINAGIKMGDRFPNPPGSQRLCAQLS
jgi:hypothetical protein